MPVTVDGTVPPVAPFELYTKSNAYEKQVTIIKMIDMLMRTKTDLLDLS
jgi:hypothetical protein